MYIKVKSVYNVGMVLRKSFFTKIPVIFEFPPQMVDAVEEVLSGEYEAGYDGSRLTIVDIGANIGSFSVWASSRWPGSTIHALEPNPQTFSFLQKNTIKHTNIKLYNKAVSTVAARSQLFFSRYAGDGEASLEVYAKSTFETIDHNSLFTVATIKPSQLPTADIIKIDVEGAEAMIVEQLKLNKTSLLLIEYQDMKKRKKIEKLLRETFTLVYEDAYAWSSLINGSGYNKKLANDYYGHIFFVNKNIEKLGKLQKVS